MVNMDNGGQNDQHFELNLVPFIDILSTCICFLLMTAIWIHIGAFNVSQALGDQAQDDKNPPSVVAQIKDNGVIEISLKDVPGKKAPSNQTLPAQGSQIDWARLEASINEIHQSLPDLQTALVMPSEKTKYNDVIRVMDSFRQQKIAKIGLAPVGGN